MRRISIVMNWYELEMLSTVRSLPYLAGTHTPYIPDIRSIIDFCIYHSFTEVKHNSTFMDTMMSALLRKRGLPFRRITSLKVFGTDMETLEDFLFTSPSFKRKFLEGVSFYENHDVGGKKKTRPRNYIYVVSKEIEGYLEYLLLQISAAYPDLKLKETEIIKELIHQVIDSDFITVFYEILYVGSVFYLSPLTAYKLLDEFRWHEEGLYSEDELSLFSGLSSEYNNLEQCARILSHSTFLNSLDMGQYVELKEECYSFLYLISYFTCVFGMYFVMRISMVKKPFFDLPTVIYQFHSEPLQLGNWKNIVDYFFKIALTYSKYSGVVLERRKPTTDQPI